ncbi:hypothetical protein NDU88_008778 [Pleurodeles waltl]|uniref:Uncharacterized protein n=1 Tax=Pleurodeles waltl TaxID=8319 RepID=A0AAV7RVR6_PLEWA|nr:hypothetical protein NDU88_008778 [Pleurodeles waltl]
MACSPPRRVIGAKKVSLMGKGKARPFGRRVGAWAGEGTGSGWDSSLPRQVPIEQLEPEFFLAAGACPDELWQRKLSTASAPLAGGRRPLGFSAAGCSSGCPAREEGGERCGGSRHGVLTSAPRYRSEEGESDGKREGTAVRQAGGRVGGGGDREWLGLLAAAAGAD